MTAHPNVLHTADLCDAHESEVRVVASAFRDFGARSVFSGEVLAVKVFEDNVLVRAALETEGRGRVLVVDGGGSLRVALVGGQLAELALRNGWSGIVVHGAVRDIHELGLLDVGIKAMGTSPRKSQKTGAGETGGAVSFGDVTLATGEFLYADRDGIVIASRALGGA